MTEKFEQPGDENPASQRHWLYGFNAFVLVLVGLVALTFLLVICQTNFVQERTKFDWSSSGSNSLSGGTQKMLVDINAKPEKYVIWSLFTDPSDQMKRDEPDKAAEQTRRRQQVKDLLDQYKRGSKQILVDDRGDAARDDIERQIRDKYKDDFKPYEAAVDDYDPLVQVLSKFLKDEAAAIGAFGQKPGTPPDEAEAAAMIQAQFAGAPGELEQDQRMIHREKDSAILPDLGMLTSRIKDTMEQIEPLFAVLSDPAKLKAGGFPPTLTAYFTSASDKYKAIEKKLTAYKAELDDLKPLPAQDVLSNLTRNAVVVMGDKSAKVVSQYDIYTDASGGAGGAGVKFNGEQAISSALYAMANPNKVKVVFVTASPQHLLDDTYSDMKGVLQDANFDVLEWSPTNAAPQPGMPPEAGGPPPAEGKGVVWVVFAPDSPSMQMMMMGGQMPDARPVVAATKEHMDRGGQVLFLAEGGGGMGPAAPFAYADLIKDFGIEVQGKYHVVNLQEQTDQETGKKVSQLSPFVILESEGFVSNEITSPVMGLPTVFGPMRMRSQGGGEEDIGPLTVVKVLSPLPTGVTAQEVVKTPYSPDYWASGAAAMGQTATKFNKDTDLAAPVPLMAVAVKDKGKKSADGSLEEKRIAVIGAKELGSNFFLELSQPVLVGNVQYDMPRFPGNQELMKNTILWLSGYENMIAVSAKSNAASRIGSVSPVQMILTRLGVLLLVPLLALVGGGIVWAMRRR